jgi:hypothetical protein
MGWAFVGLTAGSLLGAVAGFLANDHALIAQSCAITLTNFFGIYRWLIWKGKGRGRLHFGCTMIFPVMFGWKRQ